MALAVTTGTATTKDSGTSLNVDYPDNVAVGDLLLMHFTSNSAVTTPTNWTSADSDSRSSQFGYVFWKIATSGDVGQATLAVTTANEASGAGMFRITGHDASSPIGATNSANGTGAGVTVTTITPAKIQSLIFICVSSRTGTGATHSAYALATSSPSFTEHYDTVFETDVMTISAASGIRSEVTATGNATATISSGAGNGWVAFLVAVSPADESNTMTPAALALTATLPASTLVLSQNPTPSALSLTATPHAPTLATQHFPAFTNTTKNAETATNTNKNAATATNTNKNAATATNTNKTQ